MKPDCKNRREQYMLKQMHGIYLHKSAKHDLESDSFNGNTRWRDATAKEMATTKEFQVFEPLSEGTVLKQEDVW